MAWSKVGYNRGTTTMQIYGEKFEKLVSECMFWLKADPVEKIEDTCYKYNLLIKEWTQCALFPCQNPLAERLATSVYHRHFLPMWSKSQSGSREGKNPVQLQIER